MIKNNPTLKEVFTSAYQNHLKNNLKLAENLYKKVLEINPNHLESIFLLGTLSIQTKNFNVAIKLLKKATLLKPNYADAFHNLGFTFIEMGDLKQGVQFFNKTIEINLTTSCNCSQVIMQFMKKHKSGSIINITSINAEFGFPNNPAYIASKGGLKMLGKSMAKDWGKFGIRVNNLGPGYFKTNMNKKSWNNLKTRKARTIRTLLNRWGNVDELVGPCMFLASNASSYVTGQLNWYLSLNVQYHHIRSNDHSIQMLYQVVKAVILV